MKCARLIFAIVSTTNIPNSLPQIFEGASVQNYQGGHFWTPITPIMGSTLHAYPQVGQLQPHQTAYTVRVEYTEPLLPEGRSTLYVQPLVETLSPQLKRRFGNAEGSLPHVYVAHPRTIRLGPFLCLFDDKASQWTPDDLISNTTVPWASNWLSCYESWLATGKWFGTGKHIRTQPNGRSAISALMEHYHATTSIEALAGYAVSTS